MLSMPSDGVLTFNAGSMNGQEVCATFSLVDDDTLEGDESFQVALDSPTGGANLAEPMTATTTITDNESMYFNYNSIYSTEIFLLLAMAIAKSVKCFRVTTFDLVTLVQTLQRLQTTTNSVIVVLRFTFFTVLLLQGVVNLLCTYRK